MVLQRRWRVDQRNADCDHQRKNGNGWRSYSLLAYHPILQSSTLSPVRLDGKLTKVKPMVPRLLLVATSFGSESVGDHSQTRTDQNGKFRLYLAPDHAYTLGVRDLKWASETRAGVFLRTKGDVIEFSQRGTILDAVPATRVEVKVVDEAEKPLDATWGPCTKH